MNDYSFCDPNLCGYFRAAIYFVAINTELIKTECIKENFHPFERKTVADKDDSGYLSNDTSSYLNNLDVEEDISLIVENTLTDSFLEVPIESFQSTPKVKLTADAGQVPLKEGFIKLQELFGNHFEANSLQYNLFIKNINRFKNTNKQWSRVHAKNKQKYYNVFSPANWLKLTDNEKKRHTRNCEECLVSHVEIQAFFPSNTRRFKNKRDENIFHALNNINIHSKKPLQEVTNTIYSKINSVYEKKMGISFAEGLTKTKELNLQMKPTPYQKKKQKRDIERNFKTQQQHILNNTVVDRQFIIATFSLHFNF